MQLPERTRLSPVARRLRRRALHAHTSNLARIAHADAWTPAAALALAQALDTARRARQDPARLNDLLSDLEGFCDAYERTVTE